MKKISICIILCISTLGKAQLDGSFTHYSAENGLSQNTVMSIAQDRNGFLWFATWDGVNKFDGYSFTIYKANTDIGLSHNRINFISEDRYGFLWLLSYDDRVQRFNPSTERFIKIPEPQDDVNITAVKILPNGTVWLLTDNNGSFRAVTDSIDYSLETQHFKATDAFIPARAVNNVFSDAEGNEWVLGNNGLGLVKPNSAGTESFFVEESRSASRPQRFYAACENTDEIYFCSDKGRVWRYGKTSKRFVPLQLPVASNIVSVHCITPKELIITSSTDGFFTCNITTGATTHYSPEKYAEYSPLPVLSVYKDKCSELWFEQETIGKVTHFNPHLKTLKQENLNVEPAGANKALPAFHIHEDANGYTWVHPFGGGFSYFDRQKNKLIPFHNDPLSPDWRFSNKIHSAFSDRQGNLWMSTHSKGLEKISFNHSPFKIIKLADVKSHESLSNEVRALYQDADSNLWVGLKDGYLRTFDKTGKYKGYLTETGRIANSGTPVKGVVYCIAQDNKNNLWFGTKGDGLIKAQKNGDNCKLTRFKYDPGNIYSLSDDNIYSIHQDRNGRIWIATFGGGINYFDENETPDVRFINHRNYLKNYPIDRCYRVRFITSDNSNNIWVGTTVGLLSFHAGFNNPDEIKFEHRINEENDPQSLSNNDVHWISVTNGNEIYVATFGGGLNKIIRSDGKITFQRLTNEDGLSSDVLLSMKEDRDGNLWICTENGISKFFTATNMFENFDRKSMFDHLRFNEAAAARLHDNRFIFGTSAGILSFYPDSVKTKDFVPPIVFTRLQIKGETINPNKKSVIQNVINDVPKLTLSHRENIFSIQYSALDMTDPDHLKYAYILEGFDENWTYAENRRVAIYTNLPKGKYVFKVKSTNSDGIWIDNVRELPIEALPSFWETPVAWLLYFLVILSIILTSVYTLLTFFKLKHKVSVEQQVADIKLRFFTDISHELRTPLTLINGPVEHILEEKGLSNRVREQLYTVKRNSDRMLNLVNQILDFRKIQNNRMKLIVSHVNAVDLVRKTMRNFESLAQEKNIDFVFETESDATFLWLDMDKFDKIIFNLLSNAFKYTMPGKMIKIFLSDEEKSCIIGVRDQGHGISEEKRDSIFIRFENNVEKNMFDINSTGIGLSLVKEFTEMHNGKISVDSKLGKGTTFKVEFPKGRRHFGKDVEYLMSDAKHETLNEEMEADNAPEIEKQADDDNARKEIMLLTEDNTELRHFLKTVFEDSFHVVEAADGKAGLTKAVDLVPDIIISDVMMPEMDGIEMTIKLRNNIITSHIPIVLLTAKTTIDDKIAGLEYGADDYITKPFSSVYLKARVENLLAQRRKLQKIYFASLIPASTEKPPATVTEPDNTDKNEDNGISPKDRKFMDKLMSLMEENMSNSELVVEELARELAMSRSVFFKKLKSLTGLAPVEFIRDIRVKKAAQLIQTAEYTMTEISQMVGINDSRYFSKYFKKVYGVTPSGYKERFLQIRNS
jgi:signal transduction histidine kinase/DNA-binding response OmpR family regulator/ligand-binding sensor domain-containing protein